MKRILVTGVSGFLGRYVAVSLKERFTVLGTFHEHTQAIEGCQVTGLDLTLADAVDAVVRDFRPEVIVHTAALSDVDACERHPDDARRVNVQGTETLAEGAAAVGARLIYTSTDQVYDGTQQEYAETDVALPLMVYGQTKLQAERRAAAICPDTVVLRLALLYGWGTSARVNFVDRLLEQVRAGDEVPLFIDQYRSPLYVGQAAEVIGRLIDVPEVRGTFNLGGGERIHRYAFGLKCCEIFGLPTTSLRPTPMHTMAGLTARPPDCSMNSSRLSQLLQFTPLTVTEGLRAMKQQRPGDCKRI